MIIFEKLFQVMEFSSGKEKSQVPPLHNSLFCPYSLLENSFFFFSPDSYALHRNWLFRKSFHHSLWESSCLFQEGNLISSFHVKRLNVNKNPVLLPESFTHFPWMKSLCDKAQQESNACQEIILDISLGPLPFLCWAVYRDVLLLFPIWWCVCICCQFALQG